MSAADIDARVMPHSLEAERAVLGALMLRSELYAEAAEHVRSEDFYRQVHRTIFEHCTKLAAQRVTIDMLTLKDALAKSGELERVGGPVYLAGLTDGVPRSTHIANYARIVAEKAQRRRLVQFASSLVAEAYEEEEETDALLDRIEQSLFSIVRHQPSVGLQRLSTFIPAAMDQIEAWARQPGAVTGVPSGLVELDFVTRGFQPNTLVVIAARPSMGKSALVQNIGQHVSLHGRVVGMFSLEMGADELTIRSIASEAQIDGHRLQNGYIRTSDWGRLSQAFGTLSEADFYIDASPFVTIFDIRARCRRLKAEKDRLDLVIVDYAQLMISDDKHQNRNQEVSAITRGLKALAKDLHVPVIALSQLNRDLERRENKRPILADLRDSGAIEQDADIVIFIYRDEVYHDETDAAGIAELIIAKHRGGPIGTVRVAFIKEQTRFANLPDMAPPATDRQLPLGDRA